MKSYVWHALNSRWSGLSPLYQVAPDGAGEGWRQSLEQCHGFFESLYGNMKKEPGAYGLREEAYPPQGDEWDREIREYLALSKIRSPEKKYLLEHHRKKNAAEKGISAFLELLLFLGCQGEACGGGLGIGEKALEQKVAIISKKMGKGVVSTEDILEKLGFVWSRQGERLVPANNRYGDMFPALCALGQGCGTDPKRRFLFFRCDFRGLDPAFRWGVEDILRPLPARTREFLHKADRLFGSLQYRRVVEFENRYAYGLKQGVIFRVETQGDKVWCYFRWPLHGQLSTRLLEGLPAEMAGRVFEGLLPCRADCKPGYGAADAEHCGARVAVGHGGAAKFACTDMGLPVWGCGQEDLELVKAMAGGVKALFS